MLNFDDFLPNLYQKSLIFRALGWSLIPLLGDSGPSLSKAPAVPQWKEFQTRLPSKIELECWFLAQKHPIFGIILGSFSGIFVVDLDDPQRADDFARLLPDLTETFTVRSGNRRLPHYYFRIPNSLTVRSQHADGIEIRSDGNYVVAPDSRIGDKHWTIENDVMPKIITERDLNRLSAFLRLKRHEESQNRGKTASDAILGDAVSDAKPHRLTVQGLRRYYRTQVQKQGRNNALFVASRYARDCGWSQIQVERALVESHVAHPPIYPHATESPDQRRRESHITIESVFKRPARPLLEASSNQLPNSVREVLIRQKLDNVARVLDGLLMAGVEAGSRITASTVYGLLKAYGIGRNTIYNVMKLVIDSCGTIFQPCDEDDAVELKSQSPRTPLQSIANAGKTLTDKTKQCLFGRVAKSGINRGRREQVYVMPEIESLCEMLNVEVSFSDALQTDDLASPSKYRQALHTALIKRVPGQYPRRWQAARLGVSKDSCRRYEKRAGICVQPTFLDWQLEWHNVDQIIPDEAPAGQFIQDDRGRRYPPILDLARGLLAKGRRLIYRQQDANHYSVLDAVQVPEIEWLPATSQNQNVAIGNNVTIGDISKLTFPTPLPISQPHPVEQFTASTSDQNSTIHESSSSNKVGEISILMDARKPDLAERVYIALNRMNPQRALTRKRVQSLVDEFGDLMVERGLRLVRSRRDLHNPAGFLIHWLQMCNRHDSGDVKSKVVVDAETQHEQWLKALQQSPFVDYLVNADQVV